MISDVQPTAPMVARKHYSVGEIYRITVLAAHTAWQTRHLSCDPQASERVMLAVTQVNGCELCSYAHSRLALRMGMSEQEVRALLDAQTSQVPTDELPGIAFGQHYADTRGKPAPQAWTDLEQQAGPEQALCVLRATRMMMWGNATGIPLSSLRSRMRGTPDPRSSVAYEVLTTLGAALVTPLAIAHTLILAMRTNSRPVTAS